MPDFRTKLSLDSRLTTVKPIRLIFDTTRINRVIIELSSQIGYISLLIIHPPLRRLLLIPLALALSENSELCIPTFRAP